MVRFLLVILLIMFVQSNLKAQVHPSILEEEKQLAEMIRERHRRMEQEHFEKTGERIKFQLVPQEVSAVFSQKRLIEQEFPNLQTVGNVVITRGGVGAMQALYLSKTPFEGELELTPEQITQIKELRDEFGSRLRELDKKHKSLILTDVVKPDKFKHGEVDEKSNTAVQDLFEEYDRKVHEILLPHQSDLIDQKIVGQIGLGRYLVSPAFARHVKTDSAQQEKIKRGAEAAADELEKQLKLLKDKALKKLLSNLTAQQLAALEKADPDFEKKWRLMSIEAIQQHLRQTADGNYLGAENVKDAFVKVEAKRLEQERLKAYSRNGEGGIFGSRPSTIRQGNSTNR